MVAPLRIICASLVALCLTTGCSTTHNTGFCAIAKPFRLTQQTIAAMTDAEVAAALAHNKRGQALCGWKP